MSITAVGSLRVSDETDDPLTTVLQNGARCLLAQAIETEAGAFLAAMKVEALPDGRERVVRHGRSFTRAWRRRQNACWC